jgi:DNA-binding MarR family transcriptional regulator
VETPERMEEAGAASDAGVATEAWRLLRSLLEADQARWRRGLEEKGLTTVQAHALMQMAEAPPGPMSKLADRLGVDPSWVTGLVDRLEQRGEVARRASPDDRRVKIVELTRVGRDTCEDLARLAGEPPPQLSELPEEDLRHLLRIAGALLQMRRRGEEDRAGPPPAGFL